jgi:hypothetical protein
MPSRLRSRWPPRRSLCSFTAWAVPRSGGSGQLANAARGLAKAVHRAVWALRALPETRPLAQILDTRSAGIRDLRFGTLHEDDWRDDALDTFDDRRRQTPLLPRCQHTFITATITVDPHHRVGWLLGDLLVRTESAGGQCHERVIPVAPESVLHLGGLTHLNLLDHPQVYEVLRNLLTTRVAPTSEPV